MPERMKAALLLMILRSVVSVRNRTEAAVLHQKAQDKAKRERQRRTESRLLPMPVLQERRASEGEVLLESQISYAVKIGRLVETASGVINASSGTPHHAYSTSRAAASSGMIAPFLTGKATNRPHLTRTKQLFLLPDLPLDFQLLLTRRRRRMRGATLA